MENEALLQELENLAARLDITIRYDEGDFKGGLCRVNNEQLLLVNKKLPLESKINIITLEFSKLDLGNVYILPHIREKLSSIITPEK